MSDSKIDLTLINAWRTGINRANYTPATNDFLQNLKEGDIFLFGTWSFSCFHSSRVDFEEAIVTSVTEKHIKTDRKINFHIFGRCAGESTRIFNRLLDNSDEPTKVKLVVYSPYELMLDCDIAHNNLCKRKIKERLSKLEKLIPHLILGQDDEKINLLLKVCDELGL